MIKHESGFIDWWPFDGPPPKSMPKKEVKRLLRRLKELKRYSEMSNANFDGFPTKEPLTPVILEKTRIYRQTYLIDPIQLLIDRYEYHLNPLSGNRE